LSQHSAFRTLLHDLLRSRAGHGELVQTRRAELDRKAAAVLARATDPTVRAVLELHRPVVDSSGACPVCRGCDGFDGPEAEPPEWPCRTWTLIQERLNP